MRSLYKLGNVSKISFSHAHITALRNREPSVSSTTGCPQDKELVETTCYREFIDNNEDEAEEHFEWFAEHAPEWNHKSPIGPSPKVLIS